MNTKIGNTWKALLAITLLIALSATASARLADNDRDAIVYEAMYALRESNTNGQFVGNMDGDWNYIASDKDVYEIVKGRLGGYSSVWTRHGGEGLVTAGDHNFYDAIDNYGCYDGIGRGGQCLYFANLLAYRSEADTGGFTYYPDMEKDMKDIGFARPGDVIFTRDEWASSEVDHTAVVVKIKEGDSATGTVTSLYVVDSNWCAGATCEIIKCHTLEGTTLATYRIYTGVPYYAEEPPQPKLDLIFVFDTTESMGPYIAGAKMSASLIVRALDLTGFDYRVAVVDYRDYPYCGDDACYGGPSDYVYNLNLPFSSDKGVIIDAISGLTLGNGCNWRESVYSALVMSMLDVNKSADHERLS